MADHREPEHIDRDELWDRILSGDRFFLFEVLGEPYYRRNHLPGALHLPPDRVVETVTALVPDRDDEIVLYCWDDD
jgi:rhodanese-related sulfurtransferase